MMGMNPRAPVPSPQVRWLDPPGTHPNHLLRRWARSLGETPCSPFFPSLGRNHPSRGVVPRVQTVASPGLGRRDGAKDAHGPEVGRRAGLGSPPRSQFEGLAQIVLGNGFLSCPDATRTSSAPNLLAGVGASSDGSGVWSFEPIPRVWFGTGSRAVNENGAFELNVNIINKVQTDSPASSSDTSERVRSCGGPESSRVLLSLSYL